MNLRLPTLQLPSFTRTRTDAHMRTHEGVAPFVSGPAAVYAQVGVGGNVYTAEQLHAAQVYNEQQAKTQESKAQEKLPCPCEKDNGNGNGASPFDGAMDSTRRRLEENEREQARLQEKLDRIEQSLARLLEAQGRAQQGGDAVTVSGEEQSDPRHEEPLRETVDEPELCEVSHVRGSYWAQFDESVARLERLEQLTRQVYGDEFVGSNADDREDEEALAGPRYSRSASQPQVHVRPSVYRVPVEESEEARPAPPRRLPLQREASPAESATLHQSHRSGSAGVFSRVEGWLQGE
jgi:hypothetical protein